jgi:outer membrane protein assembly factor BamB
MNARKRAIIALFILGVVVAIAVTVQQALGERRQQPVAQAQTVWEFRVPTELQARFYEFAVTPGEQQVIVTSPEAVWRINEGGELEQILSLEVGAQQGESATLAGDGSRVGIMLHQQHDIVGFRLVDLAGNILASIEEPLQFHYRVSPRGDSFVGIDAAGEHIQVNADRFVYTFYDESGTITAEVTSENPQPSDSAYTPDGQAFVVSNAQGLFAYSVSNGENLWEIRKPAKLFSPANMESQLVVVSDAVERNIVEANRGGSILWQFRIEGNVRNLTISANGEFMLATDGNTAYLFTPTSETPVWSFPLPDKAFTINSAAVNDRGVVALGAQHSELNRGLVIILDADTNTIFERELAYELSNAWIPAVQFDQSGIYVLIRTLEELILLATE